MNNTLHITNGDSVVYSWRKGGLVGTHLAWRDILHEGPVPAGLSLEETSRVRAMYLGTTGYGNPIKVRREFEKRDATIARFDEFDEVVLWFEHDLYDQLQLLQILHYLGSRGAMGKVQLIQTDDYLGMLAPEELLPLQQKRRPVNAATFKMAAQVWDAFREPDPHALLELQGHVNSEMRHLNAAVRRLLEEYPSATHGLSRTETQILQTIDDGAHRKNDLFRLAQLQEEASFLGDASFFRVVENLTVDPAPLLGAQEDVYSLAPAGKAVLHEGRNWLAERPADRWIGGVHIEGSQPWRWDAQARRFVEPGA
jgi:hypothetical protein